MLKFWDATRTAVVLILAVGFTSCEHTDPVVPIPTTSGGQKAAASTSYFGVNLTGSVTSFATRPDFDGLYARLHITAKIVNPLAGPQDESDWTRAASVFGVNKVDSTGVSVDVTINGVQVPTVIPFTYNYDSATHTWTPHLSVASDTPWVSLAAGTTFGITFKNVAATQSKITTGTDVVGMVGTFGAAFAPGTWVVSDAAKPALLSAISAIQTKFDTLFTSKVVNDVAIPMSPRSDGIKSVVFHVAGLKGAQVVDIQIDVQLSSTLLRGPLPTDPTSAADVVTSGIFAGDPEALSKIQVTGGNTQTMAALLPGSAEWVGIQSKDIVTFKHECQQMKALLETHYGYNRLDRLVLLADILAGYTDYSTDPQFLSNPTCPTDEDKTLLASAGFPIKDLTNPVHVSSDQLDDLAGLVRPAVVKSWTADVLADKKKSVQSLFASHVLLIDCRAKANCDGIDPTIVASSDLVGLLMQLQADHFGCKDPLVSSNHQQTGVKFAFVVAGDTQNYDFEGWGTSDVEKGIAKVRLRRAVTGDNTWECKPLP
jgi:hypothetical protein